MIPFSLIELTLFSKEWTNRLIGDKAFPEDEKILSSGIPRFGPPRTLKNSGLLGPVSIEEGFAKPGILVNPECFRGE